MAFHGRLPALTRRQCAQTGWNSAYDRIDVMPDPPIRLALSTQGDAEVKTSTAINVPPDGNR